MRIILMVIALATIAGSALAQQAASCIEPTFPARAVVAVSAISGSAHGSAVFLNRTDMLMDGESVADLQITPLSDQNIWIHQSAAGGFFLTRAAVRITETFTYVTGRTLHLVRVMSLPTANILNDVWPVKQIRRDRPAAHTPVIVVGYEDGSPRIAEGYVLEPAQAMQADPRMSGLLPIEARENGRFVRYSRYAFGGLAVDCEGHAFGIITASVPIDPRVESEAVKARYATTWGHANVLVMGIDPLAKRQ